MNEVDLASQREKLTLVRFALVARRPTHTNEALELNGAVELTHEYAPSGDVFADIAVVLAHAALGRQLAREPVAVEIA